MGETKQAWDLQNPSVFSPLWGAWFGEEYVIANGVLASQAAALVRQAAPAARLITDTLTGLDAAMDVVQTRMWASFSTPRDGWATLYVMMRSAPVQVLVDDAVVTGAACAYDNPASNTCTDGTPCATIPVWLGAGAHRLELRSPTPGVLALAAVVASTGDVLTCTNASWHAAWDVAGAAKPSAATSLAAGLAADLPGPPQTAFTLEHPTLGLAVRMDTTSWRPCGVGGVLRLGGGATAVFSATVETDAYNWALGFTRLHVEGGGVARACYGAVRMETDASPGDPSLSFRLMPVAGGGWLLCSTPRLCAGYNASTDEVPLVPATAAPAGSDGAPVAWVLRVWPAVPAAVGPLALWLDGANVGSVALDGAGGVAQWADTRDTYVVSPRAVAAEGTPPGWGGLSCPLHFDGSASMAQAYGWDWAVPTTLTVVVSQTAGGPVLSAHDRVGDANARALSLPPAAYQAPLTVAVTDAQQAGGVTTPPVVAQRSTAPVVITAHRASPTTWAIYVNGAPAASAAFAFPYSAGAALVVGGGFDGCIHEVMVHASTLNASSVAALAAHLVQKWGTPAALVAAPPPPTPPLLATDALPLHDSLAVVEGRSTNIPSVLVAGSSGNATCVAGASEIDYVPDGSLDPTQQYVLEFRVGRV